MSSAILCPGPTLTKTVPQEWGGFDQIVAVTDAIFLDAPHTAWCFQEGPGHPHQERYRRYHARWEELQVPIWCVKGGGDRWKYNWRIPEDKIVDDADIKDLIRAFPYESRRWWSKSRNGVRPFAGSSMFHALARLIVMGSKDIHIFGADMDGYGNVDPRTGKIEISKRVANWWDDRWNFERNLLADAQREAGLHGISITKYEADYDLSEAKEEAYSDTDGWL